MTGHTGTGIGVVEDHPLFRAVLVDVLRETPGLRVVAAGASIDDLEPLDEAPLDVVLFDLHVPGRAGADGVRYLTDHGKSVLVLSAFADREDVLDAIAAGAGGYLTKDTDGPELIRAVHEVSAGRSHVCPTLAGYLIHEDRSGRPRSGHGGRREANDLTDRERDVLALLASGETDQEIACMLGISVRTVRSHLDRIRAKTGRRRRAELTRLAFESGCQ
jgi:DNA-binding NarL/FixJ family response regulator